MDELFARYSLCSPNFENPSVLLKVILLFIYMFTVRPLLGTMQRYLEHAF